jgi:hypothetical protein
MSFDEFALICTYSAINVLSQVKSGLSFFLDFPDANTSPSAITVRTGVQTSLNTIR